MLRASLAFSVFASEISGGIDTEPMRKSSSRLSPWNEDNVLLFHIFEFLKGVPYKESVVVLYTIVDQLLYIKIYIKFQNYKKR